MLDAAVIGAGQAGLAVAYFLKQFSREFVVYENGTVGNTWRTQRWDSFALNTINRMNGLPGLPYDGAQPDGFWTRDELLDYFETYVEKFALPVITNTRVVEVRSADGGFEVTLESGEQSDRVRAKNVVVASGIMQKPKVPLVAGGLSDEIRQFHTASYKNPRQLPEGKVLVVGSGQSGGQVTEDLLGAGRRVLLSTSRVARVPRRYRGKDILEWFDTMGILDEAYADLEDKSTADDTQPLVSGTGRYGHTISLQGLQARGVELLGRVTSASGTTMEFDRSVADNVKFGDERSAFFKEQIDSYLKRSGIPMPALEPDPADDPHPAPDSITTRSKLDLAEEGITSIVWCTGFTADFSWLKLPTLDDSGMPLHTNGRSTVPGLYFAGFPWLRKRKSGVIYGIEEDCELIVREIVATPD